MIHFRQAVLVVYPDGLAGRWNYLDADQLPPQRAYRDDLGFLSALIDHLSTEYTVDPAQIYVVGYSNGGMMALRLGCALSDQLAGVAVVGANYSVSLAQHCLTADPVALLFVQGTQDGTFPMLGYAVPTDYGQIDAVFSLNQAITFSTTLNGCSNQMTSTDITAPTGNTRITQYTYNDCLGDTEVTVISLVDWDHSWPGQLPTALVGPVGDGLIRDVIWAFFVDHFEK